MKPDIFYSQIPAQIPAGSVDEKVLFIGTKNGGTATSATLTQDIKFLQEETLFGANSLISESIRGFRINNQSTTLDAYAMNEAGGSVKAVGSLKIDDTASINNVLTVQINGYKYTLAIQALATAEAIVDGLIALINADTKSLVIASKTTGVDTATLVLTAITGGEFANNFSIQYSLRDTDTSLTFTITAFNGGAVNPSLSGLLTAINAIRYKYIILEYSDETNLDIVNTILENRYNNTIKGSLDGTVFILKQDTFDNTIDYLETFNSKSIAVLCNKKINIDAYKGGFIYNPVYLLSNLSSIIAIRKTPEVDVSKFILSGGTGGIYNASLPYFNTILGLDSLPAKYAFKYNEVSGVNEINELEKSGGIGIDVNDFNQAIYGPAVTTYKQDNTGVENLTYKYYNTYDQSSIYRELSMKRLRQSYSQSRLDKSIVASVKLSCIANFKDFGSEQYKLVKNDEASLSYYIKNLRVWIDESNPFKVNIRQSVPYMGQLRAIEIIETILINEVK